MNILIDTGAACTLSIPHLATQTLTPTSFKLITANGSQLNSIGIDQTEFRIGTFNTSHSTFVITDINHDAILPL